MRCGILGAGEKELDTNTFQIRMTLMKYAAHFTGQVKIQMTKTKKKEIGELKDWGIQELFDKLMILKINFRAAICKKKFRDGIAAKLRVSDTF